jgi:hypothetical protein
VLFDVRVIAFDPHAAVDPVEALIRLFKIERAFAREVVHRLPRVIKRGVSLEMAQRLGQVLERIGAQVEILVSERAPDQPEVMAPSTASLSNLPRATLGKGLPPPSPEALVAEPSNNQMGPALVPRARQQTAPRPEAFGSLPQPSHEEDGSLPLRQLANVRASLPQSQPESRRQANIPRGVDARGQSTEARGNAREQATEARGYGRERTTEARGREQSSEARAPAREPGIEPRTMVREPSEQRPVRDSFGEAPGTGTNGRALARNSLPGEQAPVRLSLPDNEPASSRQAGHGPAPGRLSLPMGSWSEGDAEESRVTRASVSGASVSPFSEERSSSANLPLAKPSVKELLARRTNPGLERISRVETGAPPAPGARAEALALPTFSAKGSSIADDIDELPETVSLRRKLTFVTVLIFIVAGVFSAGLLPLAAWLSRAAAKRRRARTLRQRQASSVLVGHAQLPELYNCVKHLAMRLELSPSPRVYVVDRLPTKVQSFTQRGGLVIALDAQFLAMCARRDAGYALQFLLAHEMAAHVLGQHRGGRQLLMSMWANLCKHELFSADALAVKLMADRNDAVRALSAQLCGPELAHLIDLNELDRQASNQEQEASKAQASADDDPTYLLPRILFLRKAPSK